MNLFKIKHSLVKLQRRINGFRSRYQDDGFLLIMGTVVCMAAYTIYCLSVGY